MNSELAKLIDSGESGTVEFKESSGKEAIETIAAFANDDGGFLCVGISDKGELKGVVATEEVVKDWLNQLKMATAPSLFPQYKIFDPTDVIIKMFDDYVEFVNPGELFGKLKIEALHTDFYRASHRNKLLAEAFYLTGEVEKYGTGFIRIRNFLKDDYSDIMLVLESDSGVFRVSIGKKIDCTAPETAPETAPQSTRDSIVLLLRKNSRYTKQDLMNNLQKASGTIKEHIRILKKEGRIKRVGPDKGGHWVVIEN